MGEIIGVIGAGTMGNGIAQTAASAGFDVVMCDVKTEFVERGIANISKSLDRFVKKETISEQQKSETLGRIKSTIEFSDLKHCSLVVEAATENFEVKSKFSKLSTPLPVLVASCPPTPLRSRSQRSRQSPNGPKR